MEKRELVEGDVLQINPEGKHKDLFGCELLVVTEPKEWGAQGYLMSSRIVHACRYNGRAYLRVKFEDMEYVGKLTWQEIDLHESL